VKKARAGVGIVFNMLWLDAVVENQRYLATIYDRPPDDFVKDL
jgi:hypothetical protein